MRWKNRHVPIPVADQKDRGLWERDWMMEGTDGGKFKKTREQRLELPRACEPVQLPSSCFTSSAFLLRKIMFLEPVINGTKSS